MSISIKKQTGSGAKVKKRLSDASNKSDGNSILSDNF